MSKIEENSQNSDEQLEEEIGNNESFMNLDGQEFASLKKESLEEPVGIYQQKEYDGREQSINDQLRMKILNRLEEQEREIEIKEQREILSKEIRDQKDEILSHSHNRQYAQVQPLDEIGTTIKGKRELKKKLKTRFVKKNYKKSQSKSFLNTISAKKDVSDLKEELGDQQQEIQDVFNKFRIMKNKFTDDIEIPICCSMQWERVAWNDVNKSMSVVVVVTLKIITNGFEDQFNDNFTQSMDQVTLYQDLIRPEIQVNDIKVEESQIMEDDFYNLDILQNNKNINDHHKNGLNLGISYNMCINLKSLEFDRDITRFSLYPFDWSIIDFRIEFKSLKIKVVGEDQDQRLFDDKFDNSNDFKLLNIRQVLLDRSHFDKQRLSNLISFKMNGLNNLETHNIYNHLKGYDYKILSKSSIAFYLKIQRVPWNIIKTFVAPLMFLQCFCLMTANTGSPETRLANLIAVQLAQGQFIHIFSHDLKSVGMSTTTIIDKLNQIGMLVSIGQIFLIYQQSSMVDPQKDSEICKISHYDSKDEKQKCWILQVLKTLFEGILCGTLCYFIAWIAIYIIVSDGIHVWYNINKNFDEMQFRDKDWQLDVNNWVHNVFSRREFLKNKNKKENQLIAENSPNNSSPLKKIMNSSLKESNTNETKHKQLSDDDNGNEGANNNQIDLDEIEVDDLNNKNDNQKVMDEEKIVNENNNTNLLDNVQDSQKQIEENLKTQLLFDFSKKSKKRGELTREGKTLQDDYFGFWMNQSPSIIGYVVAIIQTIFFLFYELVFFDSQHQG